MPAPEDLLSETNACNLLSRLFRARGYAIARNIPFREYGVSFHIDGWDAKARVGFEFLTSEDDDHDDLTLEEYKTLMDAQQRGELALFIIDEVEPLSAADLTYTVTEFLDEVAEAASAARGRRAPAKKSAKKPAAKKATKAAKKAAKKTATKSAATASRTPTAAKATTKRAKAASKKTVKKAAKKAAAKIARKPVGKKAAAKRRRS